MNGAKILTIDDEPVIRKTFVAYLEDSGFEVIEAENGLEGIAICRREHPDLVLCDIMMPEMDGLEVLSVLSRELPEIPVIVVSGMGRLNDAIQALKQGAWDYLTKPIADMAILEHAIDQALERAQLRRKNREYHEHLEATNKRLEQSLQQLKEDEEAGRRLQFQLLPEDNKRYGDYEFNRRLLTSLYLSGDFVDYFFIDSKHLGFYIADVSGHGVSSAFVTVLLKSYMSRYLELYRQHKNCGILDPAKILQRLNHNILSGGLDKYLTMFYGVIDTVSNRLHYSNSGQFPLPILYNGFATGSGEGGAAEFIGDKSLPVGLFDFAEYRTNTLDLPPNFVMLMISDGILEVLPQSKLQEKLAFLLTLVKKAGVSIGSLVQELQLDGERTLPDDITLLLIKRETR